MHSNMKLGFGIVLALCLGGCGDDPAGSTVQPIQAATIAAVGPVDQLGMPNLPVPDAPVVQVRDATGKPVPNISVTFMPSPNSTIQSGGRVLTDASGTAAAPAWVIGAAGGSFALTATVDGVPPVTFTATSVRTRRLGMGTISVRCAITIPGSAAYCWGSNQVGTVGDGTLVERRVPTAVAGDLAFSTISVSSNRACAVTTAGRLYCWGQAAGSLVPASTDPTRKYVGVSMGGGNFGCALSNSAKVYCFGADNERGQQGIGTISNPGLTPNQPSTPVISDKKFVSVTAGSLHACALDQEGVAWCWGGNQAGNLGNGSTNAQAVPARVETSQRFLAIEATSYGVCGVVADNSTYCWGLWRDGGNSLLPELVPGDIRMVSLGGGSNLNIAHYCGVSTQARVYCWGYNGVNGEMDKLGAGSTRQNERTPLPIGVEQNFIETATTTSGGCAMTASGGVYCWGYGVGTGDTDYRARPVPLLAPFAP